jgi:hypothetical protein
MTPKTVSYTGYELSNTDLVSSRVVEGPFPVSWARIVFRMDDFNTRPLLTWVIENTNGRFGILTGYPLTALYFEDDLDAVLFKLKDGHEAWREESLS